MKKIGIICEYNPLHNGHIHHFNEVKQQSKADIIILSLSSSFTQRGDLAILNKFDRAKLALTMGVDLVLECPTIFSMSDAAKFSYYHVSNLARVGVDEIWIGSELDDPSIYEKYDRLISSDKFKLQERTLLDNGYSLKLSFTKALAYFGYKELKSNDLLGLFYYKSIKKINPSIRLMTIKRKNNDYQDTMLNSSTIQSATAIRAALDKADTFVPDFVVSYLKKTYSEDMLLPFIKLEVIKRNFKDLLEANEGIENRLALILNSSNIHEAITSLKTKRYSDTKNKRLLMNCLLGLTKNVYLKASKEFDFLRVLGFNSIGKEYLSSIKKQTKIYTNIKNGINSIFDFELSTSKIIDLIYNDNLMSLEQKGPIINEQ